MSRSYHHPHLAPKKSLPSDFPPSNLQEKVIVLAKVNLTVTIVPVICFTLLLLLFYFRLDLVQDFAKSHNDTFLGESLLQFTSKEQGDKQWQTVFLQFGWCVAEAILAYVLLHGSKLRDYGYMKAWLLIMTATFIAEVAMQGMLLSGTSFSDLPIVLLALFTITDLYRFSCLFIVYLLIDEMLERGEVKRDMRRESNFDPED